jgi:S1-C subfamily serine protease
MVSEPSSDRVALRPVFVAALEPMDNALWPDPIWAFVQGTDITPGAFVFSTSGELAGIVIAHGDRRAIVPPATLLAEVERLTGRSAAPGGDLGIRVQALNPDLSVVTGATIGVVVTWVAPGGPAARLLAAGDVIEAIDGYTLSTSEHWEARLARLSALDTATLRVRRQRTVRDVPLQVPAAATPIRDPSLGLRLRQDGAGSQVLGVDPGSAGSRAGLATGDLITHIAAIASPTPADVRAAFTSSPEGTPVLVAVTRGATHFVTTVTRSR